MVETTLRGTVGGLVSGAYLVFSPPSTRRYYFIEGYIAVTNPRSGTLVTVTDLTDGVMFSVPAVLGSYKINFSPLGYPGGVGSEIQLTSNGGGSNNADAICGFTVRYDG